MSFQTYRPSARGRRHLASGCCSISTAGIVRLAAEDLRSAHIGQRVVLLVDADTGRLGFRPPTDDDPLDLYMTVMWGRTRKSALIRTAGAIKSLGLTPATVAGVHPVTVRETDRLIVVNLPAANRASATTTPRRRRATG